MAYRSIESRFKLEVIKNFWITSNISQTAKKYGVSRNTIYEWTKFAEETLLAEFVNLTPGKRTIDLAQENKKLKERLNELLDGYHKLSQKGGVQNTIPSKVVLSCSKCESEHVRKNGRVYTKSHGLRQRVSCRICSFSVYVGLKKTL